MGCNCKAKKKISYIQAKYGDGRPNEQEKSVLNPGHLLKTIALYTLLIISLPLIVIMMLFWGVFVKNSTINIGKLFKI